jgi:HSP90 family molecular chaperone
LIQNAADAVRARRKLQRETDGSGSISVRLGKTADTEWLEVSDNGVGMSQRVLTKALLDFGSSFWASPDLPAEFPGLLSSGFDPAGRFGIGFFSVFMLGQRVRVVSRPYLAGAGDTAVLEFEEGPRERPVLRAARDEEQLADGGTCVRVWLDPSSRRRLLERGHREWTLHELCEWLCPALDVDVLVETSSMSTTVPSTWKSMEAAELLGRARAPSDEAAGRHELGPYIQNVRPIYNDDGEMIARLAIYPKTAERVRVRFSGVVSLGGLRSSSLVQFLGIVLVARSQLPETSACQISPAGHLRPGPQSKLS